MIAVACAGASLALAGAGAALASHGSAAGPDHDFAVGSGTNPFITGGPAHLSVAAQADPDGAEPRGHVRAKGDLDGDGPLEAFRLEGEVTCLRVEGNRAAIKYRFKHADGDAAPFEGGGVQIFIEDNGPPRAGEPIDRTTFDPPQPQGVYDLLAHVCDDPRTRVYDRIESGDFVVHDATP